MNESSADKLCPKCGAPIPAEAPLGLCPRCALAGAATETDAGTAPAHHHTPPSLAAVRAAFPQFEVIELIGAGGMGAVFKARQPKLDRLVALKLLAEPLGKNPAFAERFNREARMLAKLSHPNIVSVFDFGEAGGFFYLLMEFVDGVNLRQAMRAGRFTPAQALEIVPKICEALQFAHEQGILHRDIKPENILLDQKGRVKIADFGIAKLVGAAKADVTLTASGASLGTPAYMAPEQIERPGEVDHRADIYSLGVVFYEMLTGELPLGRFAPPSKKTPLDERVDEIVLRALAKERELRQQSAGEVKTEVEEVTTTLKSGGQHLFTNQPTAPSPPAPQTSSRSTSARALRRAVAVTGVPVALFAATPFYNAWERQDWLAFRAELLIASLAGLIWIGLAQRLWISAKTTAPVRRAITRISYMMLLAAGLVPVLAAFYLATVPYVYVAHYRFAIDNTILRANMPSIFQESFAYDGSLRLRKSRRTRLFDLQAAAATPQEAVDCANNGMDLVKRIASEVPDGNLGMVDPPRLDERPSRPNVPMVICIVGVFSLSQAGLGLLALFSARRLNKPAT